MDEDKLNVNRRAVMGAAAACALGGVAGALGTNPAHAAPPLLTTPLAGALRRKVGDFEITALLDGYLDFANDLVLGFNADEGDRLRKAAFLPGETVRIPVNAYLVNTGERLVLVDAGTADTYGPTLGHLHAPLAAIGIAPEQIDAIMITHMHIDHLFGVIDGEGNKMFPNAELILPEAERAYWYDDAHMNAVPEASRQFFVGARRAADAYNGRQTLISAGQEIVPGIRALDLAGHTPGHTGYVLESGGETLVIAGDIVHVATYQFARPEWGVAFDVDPVASAATRRRFLDQMATERVLVAGMHVPFPGWGHVVAEGEGFRFAPAEWQY